ncbi:hypothetical protein ACGGZK_06545 [Agromyces sp. MMS24-K17]|uniref:hypothetical protein n=1 Tax=Agromyces sp. MMS24-K17 TaxID=3372850 RepID=UPI003754AB52
MTPADDARSPAFGAPVPDLAAWLPPGGAHQAPTPADAGPTVERTAITRPGRRTADIQRYYLCSLEPSGEFDEVIVAVSDGDRRRYFTTRDGAAMHEVDEDEFELRRASGTRSLLELSDRELGDLETELGFVRPVRGRNPVAEQAARPWVADAVAAVRRGEVVGEAPEGGEAPEATDAPSQAAADAPTALLEPLPAELAEATPGGESSPVEEPVPAEPVPAEEPVPAAEPVPAGESVPAAADESASGPVPVRAEASAPDATEVAPAPPATPPVPLIVPAPPAVPGPPAASPAPAAPSAPVLPVAVPVAVPPVVAEAPADPPPTRRSRDRQPPADDDAAEVAAAEELSRMIEEFEAVMHGTTEAFPQSQQPGHVAPAPAQAAATLPADAKAEADAWSQVGLAKGIAFVAHRGQEDRVGAAYIDHPGRVAEAFDPVAEPVETAAAWLHGVLERSDLTERELAEAGVAPEVIEVVRVLTRAGEASDDEYHARVARHPVARRVLLADLADETAPWRLRRLDHDAQQRLVEASRRARLVLGAD